MVNTAARPAATESLWGRGFGWLLGGQTVSTVGSQVTFVALPLIAVNMLHASPAAMGLLGAVDNLPYLLIGLFVGVWADRWRRRRLMIAADLIRLAAVAAVPLTFLAGRVSFIELCVVAFVVGVGNIVFDVSCQALLPEVVPAGRLGTANGALQTTAGLAAVIAPGLGGALIKIVGAPLALLADAGSYVVSVATVLLLPANETRRVPAEGSTWVQVRAGLAAVRADRRLVALAGAAATVSFAMNVLTAVLVYELSVQRGMGALGVGLVFVVFGVGGALGSVGGGILGDRGDPRLGLVGGPALAAVGLGAVAVSAAVGGRVLLFVGVASAGLGLMAQQVVTAAQRQRLAPEATRGRVLGTMRFLEWGIMPLGALTGGALGQTAGTTATLGIAAGLVGAAALWCLTFGRPGRTEAALQPMPDRVGADRRV